MLIDDVYSSLRQGSLRLLDGHFDSTIAWNFDYNFDLEGRVERDKDGSCCSVVVVVVVLI